MVRPIYARLSKRQQQNTCTKVDARKIMMRCTVRRVVLVTLVMVIVVLFGFISSAATELQLTFAPHDLQFQVGESKQFEIFLSSVPNETFGVSLVEDKNRVIDLSSSNVIFIQNQSETYNVTAAGRYPGMLTVWANGSRDGVFDGSQAFVRIKVKAHGYLDTLSDIIGWVYFTAWSISFYPQIIMNIKRRSVVGLHLDFLALNIVGFLCYSLFNCGLYFNEEIQAEYFVSHPRGVNPVQLNDVVFSLHAVGACLITGLQAIVFERAEQKVSRACVTLLGTAFIFIGISLVLTVEGVITWLTYLYYFSFVKLVITIVKYMPQAYFNFRRHSTLGWSIGNVLLDFTGGALSILQMFIIAYNYDDWGSLFGDPTKFGLGLFSILFDMLFMVQHYLLYGPKPSSSNIRGSSKMSPSPYRSITPSHSGADLLCDPNVHRSYQVQESPDKNDNIGVNGLR